MLCDLPESVRSVVEADSPITPAPPSISIDEEVERIQVLEQRVLSVPPSFPNHLVVYLEILRPVAGKRLQ